jgi:hypothetical protein
MSDVMTRTSDDFLPAAPIDFGGPTGFEWVSQDCVTIPFLKVAQASTPEAKYRDPAEIEGLKPGMFFCAASRKVYGENIKLIILKFYRQFIIYESNDPGSKFLGTMNESEFKLIEPSLTREKSYHLNKNGNRYVDTRNFIVLVHGHLEDGPMLMSLQSTGIKPSRQLMTMATNVMTPKGRAPIWSSGWELGTGYQTNDSGQSYHQIARVSRLGFIPVSMAKMVEEMFLDVQSYGPEVLEESAAKEHTTPAPEAKPAIMVDRIRTTTSFAREEAF